MPACLARHLGLGLSLCLTLSLTLCLPAATLAATSPSIDGAARAASKGASRYTGTVSPPTTATLASERPLFSAFATASLPFGGLIHQNSVFSVARNVAYLEALHAVALSLTKHTAAHIGAHEMPRRMALAMAAYSPTVSKSVTSLPLPAGNMDKSHTGDELLTVLVRLEAPLNIVDSRLLQTMRHPGTWELYTAALLQMQSNVQEGSELITRAAALRKNHGAHMDEAFMNRITYLADQLDALWIYIHTLPSLRTLWDNPALVQKQMQRALTLAPQHPLLWCALGEAQLQLDLPQKALDSLNTALKFAPDLGRALYARGIAHLRLQQSALAENDLTAALNLQPHTVHWLRARGAIRMVREAYGPMCADFQAACALGDCDGLITARKRDLCLPKVGAHGEVNIDEASITENKAPSSLTTHSSPAPSPAPRP